MAKDDVYLTEEEQFSRFMEDDSVLTEEEMKERSWAWELYLVRKDLLVDKRACERILADESQDPLIILEKRKDYELTKKRLKEIDAELSSGFSEATKAVRFNVMKEEIIAAIDELGGDTTVYNVMRVLETYAGKEGSCIFDVAPDGVLWIDGDGNKDKLTVKMLRERIRRLRR